MTLRCKLTASTAVLLLATTACGRVPVEPVPAVAVVEQAASIQLLHRLTTEAAASMPELTGLPVSRARAILLRRGLRVQVVALELRARRVSAQWPEAGEPLPTQGPVVVWRGRPPSPPEPAPLATPSAEVGVPAASAAPAAAAAAQPAPAATPATAGTPAPTPAVTPKPARDAAEPERNADSQPQPQTPATTPAPTPSAQRLAADQSEPAGSGETLSGLASWYGPGFVGRMTACGGTFDPGQLTLASQELACGTQVRIIGPAGSSVEAVVGDWGPAEWTGRRFDLSRATFEAIADLGAGVIDVNVDVAAPG